MSNAVRTLKSLIALLDREAREIKKRNFDAIASLTKEKIELSEAIAAIANKLTRSDSDNSLHEQLELIAGKARENAENLLLFQNGLADARRRLEKLAEENRRTGVYAPGGDAIKRAAPARMEREA